MDHVNLKLVQHARVSGGYHAKGSGRRRHSTASLLTICAHKKGPSEGVHGNRQHTLAVLGDAQVISRTIACVTEPLLGITAFNALCSHALQNPAKIVKRVNGVDNLTEKAQAVFEAEPHLLRSILEPGPRHMTAALALVTPSAPV